MLATVTGHATSEPPAEPQRLARRILAFAGLPFLSLAIPFLFLPILARVAGADAWLAIAVGQSVGAFCALFVSIGYNTVGPTMVALAEPEHRAEVLRKSIPSRLLVFLPAVVLAATVSFVIAPESHRIDAVIMSAAMTITGLSSAWYMVGLGRASLIVVYELVPRMLATGIAAVILLTTGHVIWYPLLLVVAGIAGVTAYVARTAGIRRTLQIDRAEVARTLKHNRSAMATEVVAGSYNSLAVTLVSVSATVEQAARYVSGDKLYRIGQYSVSALGNALQGWAVESDRQWFSARARQALILHACLGFLGLLGFAIAGPWLSNALFGDVVTIDRMTALGFGVATLGIALGTALGRIILVGLGARREFLLSVSLGALIGVPTILTMAAHFGAAGGAWGLAVGETASVVCQTVFARRRWRQWRNSQPLT